MEKYVLKYNDMYYSKKGIFESNILNAQIYDSIGARAIKGMHQGKDWEIKEIIIKEK